MLVKQELCQEYFTTGSNMVTRSITQYRRSQMIKDALKKAQDDANSLTDKIQSKGWILYAAGAVLALIVVVILSLG